jgi:hypothetical protein
MPLHALITDLQKSDAIFSTASGTNTYVVAFDPAITAYVIGQRFFVVFTNANTGASTLNIDGLGVKTLVKNGSSALVSGDIVAGQIYAVVYDGTNLQVVGKFSSPALVATLNTGTDNKEYASSLGLEGSKYLTQSGTKTYAVSAGTDTYTATLTPAITAYATGQKFMILFSNSNTGASTININNLGAKAITKFGATPLAQNDIRAGQIFFLVYDGTNFQIV